MKLTNLKGMFKDKVSKSSDRFAAVLIEEYGTREVSTIPMKTLTNLAVESQAGLWPVEEFNRRFEPQGDKDDQFENWRSVEPNIDIRHGKNLTKSKWSINDFRDKRTAINFKEGECPEWAKGLII